MVLDVGMGDVFLAANESTGLHMSCGTWPSPGEEPLDSNRNHVPPFEGAVQTKGLSTFLKHDPTMEALLQIQKGHHWTL